VTEPIAPALEMRGVTKRFGSLTAVRGIDLEVARGSVHALLGENGAGKTTLMRLAYGLLPPDSGEIRCFGQEFHTHDVAEARRAGIGMVHQHLSIVPTFTVLENLSLGGSGRFDRRAAARRLAEVSEASGLAIPTDAVARDLSVVQQQRLEILKALARGARLLILDEPTAVLTPSEISDLLRWTRAFADSGGSVILVTHKLHEALSAADAVTVLRRGAVVFRSRAAQTSATELANYMFPDAPAYAAPTLRADAAGQSTVVAARALRIDDDRRVPRIRNADFEVRSGEIVGIAGVEGSGYRDLILAVAGLRPVASGALNVPSRIAFVPADRLRDALILEFTLAENVALRGAGHRRGLMRWRAITDHTRELLQAFAVVPPMPDARARSLSGGNQQRVVVARELDGPVDLLVADNPTRGLDLQATTFVQDRIRAAAASGAAVIVHSSDLDEMLALATRVLVVFEGTVRELPCDREMVGRAMLGAA
jgi:general nucleoside transport system ATP-binding protein